MIFMPKEKTKDEKAAGEIRAPLGKSPEEIEEELQRRSVQLRILQANMQIIHERHHVLSMRLQEFEETKQTISDIKSVKSGSEILMPIGSGNFVYGKVSDTEKVLVGVGGGIAIKKSPENALVFLDERIAEAKAAMEELGSQFAQMESEIRMLQSGAMK